MFQYSTIGEAAKKLSNDFINENDKVAWKSIKGMRDILVHAYGSIDIVTIWKTSKQDITPLKNYCEEILDKDIKKHEQKLIVRVFLYQYQLFNGRVGTGHI